MYTDAIDLGIFYSRCPIVCLGFTVQTSTALIKVIWNDEFYAVGYAYFPGPLVGFDRSSPHVLFWPWNLSLMVLNDFAASKDPLVILSVALVDVLRLPQNVFEGCQIDSVPPRSFSCVVDREEESWISHRKSQIPANSTKDRCSFFLCVSFSKPGLVLALHE